MQAINKFAVAEAKTRCVVHMDLDGYDDICRVHGWRVAKRQDTIFETGMRNALELFARHNICASLFTIAHDVEDTIKKEYLGEAVRRGHEIASHTVTHRTLTELGSEDKRREIVNSRIMLEQALGVAVRGFRAPGFGVDGEVLRLLEIAGYEYDSSLFPGEKTARRADLGSVPLSPFAVDRVGRLIELPMPAFAPLPMPFHPCYSLVLGNWYFKMGIRRFQRTGAPLVLLFHLTDFADPVPSEELPNWKARVYTLSFLSRLEKMRRCEDMMNFVKQYYSMVTTADLLRDYKTAAVDAARVGSPA